MKFESYNSKWCPLGRISIQQPSGNGGIAVVPGGAFNTIILAQDTQDPGKSVPFLASMCVGPQCPLYRKPLFPWRWGRCAFAKDSLRGTIWAVFWTAVGLAAAVTFAVYKFCPEVL